MSKTKREQTCTDIQMYAFTIVQEVQWHNRLPNMKCLKIMGAMVWQITKALVTLRRII